jgi:hypothetical protein
MAEPFLTAEQLAERLGVTRSFVYEHAAELGAFRLGSGPRARLRFDLDEVRRRTSSPVSRESPSADPPSPALTRPRQLRRMVWGAKTRIDLVNEPPLQAKPSLRTLRAGELLDAHIRLEVRQLFPLIEELVPDDELRRLGLASRDLTCAVRRPPLRS